MKKTLTKIALYSTLLINLAFVNPVAFAEPVAPSPGGSSGSAADLSNMHKILYEIGKKPCIDEIGKDSNFLITVIEEPLDIKDDETAEDFKYRKCFRHSFTYVDDDGKSNNLSELSNKTAICDKSISTKAEQINKGNFPGLKSANYFCKEVQVILSKGGTSMIYGYIGMLYRWGASIAGLIAVTVIIISGIQISAAGGDPEAVGSAKKRILQSIAGIIVLFLSGLILYTINPNFFVAS